MRISIRFARVWVVIFGITTLAMAVEMPAGPGQPAGMVVVPEGVDGAAVQKAILLAGAGRGWTVKTRSDGQVVLFLEHGGWRATLTLDYDTHQVSIRSNSAKLDRKGNPKKIAIPETWVNFLRQDITKNLGQTAYGK